MERIHARCSDDRTQWPRLHHPAQGKKSGRLVKSPFRPSHKPPRFGVPEEIRTPDPTLRRRVLYPAELLGHMQICRLKLRTIFVRRLIACILYNALPCLSSFHAGLSARPARFAYLCFTGCSARPRRRSIRRSFPLFSRSSFVFSSENAASTPISSDSSLC